MSSHENKNIKSIESIITPKDLKERLPLDPDKP